MEILRWFRLYFEDRKQFVTLDNYKSDTCMVKTGVPHSSILGPLLFILFVNDIFYVSNNYSAILFADDTNLFISDDNPVQLFKNMNNELSNYHRWFSSNKLALNLNKSCFILFGPKIIINQEPRNI